MWRIFALSMSHLIARSPRYMLHIVAVVFFCPSTVSGFTNAFLKRLCILNLLGVFYTCLLNQDHFQWFSDPVFSLVLHVSSTKRCRVNFFTVIVCQIFPVLVLYALKLFDVRKFGMIVASWWTTPFIAACYLFL